MRKILSAFVALFGAICLIISFVHILFGPAAIPGSVPVNATMDSEDRFYATLFTGFGITMIWCSLNLEPRIRVFHALLAVFFLGGVSRIVSVTAVGWPSGLFVFLGSLELLLPPLLLGVGAQGSRRGLKAIGADPVSWPPAVAASHICRRLRPHHPGCGTSPLHGPNRHNDA